MKIAITGTIGSGKTTVCEYLESKGYYIFDCDRINSKLFEEGNSGYVEIKKSFPQVFDEDKLNKFKLAELVFNCPSKKKELESIMHPLILNKMLEESKKHELFIAEVPLLFEVNWDTYFDHKLLITCDKDIALERLKLRGLSLNDAILRINSQMPVEDKIKRANEIIYNNGSLSLLHKDIDAWLDKYVR